MRAARWLGTIDPGVAHTWDRAGAMTDGRTSMRPVDCGDLVPPPT